MQLLYTRAVRNASLVSWAHGLLAGGLHVSCFSASQKVESVMWECEMCAWQTELTCFLIAKLACRN